MNQPIIQIKDLYKSYPGKNGPAVALEHINLDIYPGEKVLIVGPSGSGKSTLASCINGLIPNSFPGKMTGELYINGIDAKKAFSAYFEALFTYPDVVIKDRLDGANIVWDVNQPEDGFTYKGFIGIHNFPYTIKVELNVS